MLKLISDQTREETWIAEKTFNIGGDIDNHLVLQSDAVAPFHARIVFDGQHHWLKDLNSTAGTYVNNQRISHRQLHDGDKLGIGNQTFQVVNPLVPGNQHQWCLVANSGWLSGRVYPLLSALGENHIKIGRGRHCDIVFPGTHLAREHLDIELADDHIKATSLRPDEGLFINDRCLNGGDLRPGDTIRLDVHSFTVFGPVPSSPSLSLATPPNNINELADKLNEPVLSPVAQNNQKRWITRSTSPGNRDEFTAPPQPTEYFFVKLIVAIAVVCLAGLGIYLWVG